jgi:hypothetical protein
MKSVTVLVPKGEGRVEEIRKFLTAQIPDLTVLVVESDLVADPYVGKVTGNDAAAAIIERIRAMLFEFLRGQTKSEAFPKS